VTARSLRRVAAAAVLAAAAAPGGAAAQELGLDCPGPACPMGAHLANQDGIEDAIRRQLDALANAEAGERRTISIDGARLRGAEVDREAAGLSPAPPPPAHEILGDVAPGQHVMLEVGFAAGSAEVRHAPGALDPICRVLREQAGRRFAVVGHTDASGPADYNERLSRRRAESVAALLKARCGLMEGRLLPVGLGETQPLPALAPTSPEQRRVELQVLR